tara:strand:+ start:3027 stop:3269 length:243 start_codon:yes stop_codon:yes gene_type:complete
MTKGNIKLNVVAHVMLRNFWEYYITELPDETGIGMALVMGHCTEYGTIAQDDIENYAISYTTQLDDVMPADGYSWENDNV